MQEARIWNVTEKKGAPFNLAIEERFNVTQRDIHPGELEQIKPGNKSIDIVILHVSGRDAAEVKARLKQTLEPGRQ